MNKKLDIGAVWNDALALLRNHSEITVIIIGLFMLVPLILIGLVAPQPAPMPGATPDDMMAMLSVWFADNWYWFVGLTLLSAIGQMALLLVVLGRDRPTVEAALKMATGLLPLVLLTGLLQSLIIGFGFLLLIIPGIYFAIKLSLSSPIIAAEGLRNPIDIFRRSWSLTKGNSLRIFGLLLLVGIGGVIAMFGISLVFNVIMLLVLPASVSEIVIGVMSAVLQMALTVLLMFVMMAVYRQLSAD